MQDNCPITWNPSQADNDSDELGDACDADDDNDGVIDSEDNCQFVANPSQEDFDEDGAGDACDTDDDGDGTLDAVDECPETPLGNAVSANGCSIAQLCPCAHSDGADRWKNHGAYVSCVAHTSEVFVGLGLITDAEKDTIVSVAAASSCEHKPR